MQQLPRRYLRRRQRRALVDWLEGWSLCLAEINYLRTGYRFEGLLDAHLITDEDVARHTMASRLTQPG